MCEVSWLQLLLVIMLAGLCSAKKQLPMFSVNQDYAIETWCEGNATSCQFVNIKFRNLHEILTKNETELVLPPQMGEGMVFKLVNLEDSTVSGYKTATFKSKNGDTAIFSINIKTLSVHGMIRLVNNHVYSIIKCGDNCHKVVKYTRELNEGDDTVDLRKILGLGEDYSTVEEFNQLNPFVDPENTSIAETTITIYVTKEFLADYKDPFGAAAALIDNANEGYKLNKIPIHLKLHCLLKAPFSQSDPRWLEGETWRNSGTGAKKSLFAFANLGDIERKWNDLRVSADLAYLLLGGQPGAAAGESFFGIGKGNFEGASIGFTYASPAFSQFTLEHEIAHIYGAEHERSRIKNPRYSFGQGYFIPPEGSSGYRTLMAYSREGHEKRLQYMSGPDIQGTAPNGVNILLGDPQVADNRRIIVGRRFQIAAMGDESIPCPVDMEHKSFDSPGEQPTLKPLNRRPEAGEQQTGRKLVQTFYQLTKRSKQKAFLTKLRPRQLMHITARVPMVDLLTLVPVSRLRKAVSLMEDATFSHFFRKEKTVMRRFILRHLISARVAAKRLHVKI